MAHLMANTGDIKQRSDAQCGIYNIQMTSRVNIGWEFWKRLHDGLRLKMQKLKISLWNYNSITDIYYDSMVATAAPQALSNLAVLNKPGPDSSNFRQDNISELEA